jgi:hypothetical protein
VSVYKRGGVYWYDFWFQGQRHRGPTKLRNRTAAESAEAIRKAQLAEARAGIIHRKPCPAFEDFVNTEFLPWSEKEHQAHSRTHKRYAVSAETQSVLRRYDSLTCPWARPDTSAKCRSLSH